MNTRTRIDTAPSAARADPASPDAASANGPSADRWRFDAVVRRLEALPDPLPPPPAILMPIRLDTGEPGRAPATGDPSAGRPAAVLVLVTPGTEGTYGAPELEPVSKPRSRPERELDARPAAESEAEIVLIERVDRGGHHSGEISFPGGRAEPGESAEETALREAVEEVGLDPRRAGVRIVGRLESFWIPVSDFRVQPIVAVAARRPDLHPSPDEVASILRAPLSAFGPGGRIEVVEREIRGWRLRYGAYPVGGHLVWGATARVLGQLGALLGT